MHRHLFGHVDLAPNRAHVLDGTVPEAFAAEHAAEFDRWIAADGGLDLQLLGIGRNGHIGFNEPTDLPVDEALALPTRLVDLHPTTLADAASDFGGEARVIPPGLDPGRRPDPGGPVDPGPRLRREQGRGRRPRPDRPDDRRGPRLPPPVGRPAGSPGCSTRPPPRGLG